MKHHSIIKCACGALLLALILPGARASEFSFSVIATGLNRPTGITIHGGNILYFTEIPEPGVGGGMNAVKSLKLGNGDIDTIHMGEPEPVNITVSNDGDLYWTCKSAGVILWRPHGHDVVPLLTGLEKPSGIDVDPHGNVYFTEIPTPATPMGANKVSVFDGVDVTVLHMGEPEPADITIGRDGDLYWTCKSAGVILAQDPHGNTSVLLGGLNQPVGIALDHRSRNLYWTEVPTPGVSGGIGGSNKIWRYSFRTGVKTLIHEGDPEPTDITVGRNGNIYWTCTSAGVIVEGKRRSGGPGRD